MLVDYGVSITTVNKDGKIPAALAAAEEVSPLNLTPAKSTVSVQS